MNRTFNAVRFVLAALPPPPDESVVTSGSGGGQGDRAAGGEGGGAERRGRQAAEGDGGSAAIRGRCAAGGDGGADEGCPSSGGDGGAAARKGCPSSGGDGGDTANQGGQEVANQGEAVARHQSSGCSGGQDAGGAQEDQKHVVPVSNSNILGKYDIYLDLLFGRPVCTSSLEYWQNKPLVLHDQQLLVARMRANKLYGLDEETLLGVADLSKEITAILQHHPGPVQQFRIDSTCWTAPETLNLWLQLLSSKDIESLTIVNLAHKVDDAFTIQELQSANLKYLFVAFMKIPNLDLQCFASSRLLSLNLMCCCFEGRKLSWVITQCPSLRSVTLAFATEDMRICSESLEMLTFLQSTAHRLVIESAPRLGSICLGIKPKSAPALLIKPRRVTGEVCISIDDASSVKIMDSLMLPYHRILVENIDITKKCAVFSSVVFLSIGLKMSDCTQRYRLRKMLDCFPMLAELTVWRMDEVSDEALDVMLDGTFEDLHRVSCVASHLESFRVEDFRGGAADTNLILCVLKNAPNLASLITKRCRASSRKKVRVDVAIAEIESCERAAAHCVFTHL